MRWVSKAGLCFSQAHILMPRDKLDLPCPGPKTKNNSGGTRWFYIREENSAKTEGGNILHPIFATPSRAVLCKLYFPQNNHTDIFEIQVCPHCTRFSRFVFQALFYCHPCVLKPKKKSVKLLPSFLMDQPNFLNSVFESLYHYFRHSLITNSTSRTPRAVAKEVPKCSSSRYQ